MEVALGDQVLADRDLTVVVPAVAEAEDVALRPVRALEAGAGRDQLVEAQRLVVAVADVVAKAPLAAPGEVEKQLEPDAALRALEGAVGEVDPDALLVLVEEVARLLVERAHEVGAVACEHGGAEARGPQHLVRVPDHGVGALDSVEHSAVPRREQSGRSVGGVGVEPDAVALAEVG